MRFVKVFILLALLTAGCQNSGPDAVEQTAVIETQVAIILQPIVETAAAQTQVAQAQNLPTEASTELPAATENLLQIPHVPEAGCIPIGTQRNLAQVVTVIDGDTIDVSINGQNFRVRYIGMDTPELGMPFGEEATDTNKQMVENQQVLLVKDVSEVDRYGRLLRYVFVGNQFVNYELVKRGSAQILTYPPDVSCQETLLLAQQVARDALLGLWVPTPTAYKPPLVTTIPTQQTKPAQQGNCDPAYPTVCIPPSPPDLDCKDIPYRRFKVLPPDPHRFDGDHDGIGCESG